MIDFIDIANSSQIAKIGYEKESQTLYVVFKSNQMEAYCYANVPNETFEELKEAESVGKYFSANIKSKFDWTKIQLTSLDNQ